MADKADNDIGLAAVVKEGRSAVDGVGHAAVDIAHSILIVVGARYVCSDRPKPLDAKGIECNDALNAAHVDIERQGVDLRLGLELL